MSDDTSFRKHWGNVIRTPEFWQDLWRVTMPFVVAALLVYIPAWVIGAVVIFGHGNFTNVYLAIFAFLGVSATTARALDTLWEGLTRAWLNQQERARRKAMVDRMANIVESRGQSGKLEPPFREGDTQD